MGTSYSTFSTISNEEHRIERCRLSPFFSRKMVLELEDSVQSKAEKLCSLVAEKFYHNQPVDLHHGFRAVSIDIITDYAFNQYYDLLDRPDFGIEFFFMIQGLWPYDVDLSAVASSLSDCAFTSQTCGVSFKPALKATIQRAGGRKTACPCPSSRRIQLIDICLALQSANCLCKD
jgi:hypothetical protein